jgi:hypothetical protein
MTDDNTKRVGYFVDTSTCWEYKTDEIIGLDSDKNAFCKNQEIPAFTRLVEVKPKFVFIPESRPRNSINNVEIVLTSNKAVPNSVVTPLPLLECKTPITNQFLGCVLLPLDSLLSHLKKVATQKEANCIILPDIANDWVLQLHSIRHIRKGDSLSVFLCTAVESKNPEAQEPESTDPNHEDRESKELWHQRAVAPWLPTSLHYLAPLLGPLVIDSKQKLVQAKLNEDDNFHDWQLHIVIYALRIMLDPKTQKIDALVQDFNSTYCKNRQCAPFLLQSLFIEGIVNAPFNPKWFSHFSARTLLNAKSTKVRIQ